MIFFIASLFPVYLYLGFRLAEVWHDWLVIGLLFAFIVSFPFRKLFRYQLHLSYASMGVLTYLVVFTVLRDFVWLLSSFSIPISYVLSSTLAVNVFGFYQAWSGPKIKRVLIPHQDPELQNFTIAQISDLHIGPTIRKKYVEDVVRKINDANVDLVVLTGDIGDGHARTYREDTTPLKALRSKYGTFFVPGNHEYYWNANEWLTVMNNLGIINLVNRGKVISIKSKKVLIAGIPDPVSGLLPELGQVQESESSDSADFKILLSHRPGIANEAARFGFDLQLSGHTHGGQFFPWTIVVKFVHKLSVGLHRVGNMWLYISPGTGSWGPLLRVGTTPEISLITLSGEKNLPIKNLNHP